MRSLKGSLLLVLSLVSFVYSISATKFPADDIYPNNTGLKRSTSTGADAYRCETSSGSPLSQDVLNTAAILKGRGTNRCQQTNTIGTQCKQLKSFSTASVGICAIPGQWIECFKVAVVVNSLVSRCQSLVNGQWKIGGYVIVEHPTKPENAKIIVYNSKNN